MEDEILDTFVEALRQVFAETEIPVQQVDDVEAPPTGDQVVTSVGLSGDIRGILMLIADAPAASRIAQAMTAGLAIPLSADLFDEVHLAALAELANQISGRAITMLFERSVRCDITPPAVIAAQGIRSLVPNLARSFHRVARGDFGRLSVFLGIQDRSGPGGLPSANAGGLPKTS